MLYYEFVAQFDAFVRPTISKRNPHDVGAIKKGWAAWLGQLLKDELISIADYQSFFGRYSASESERQAKLKRRH